MHVRMHVHMHVCACIHASMCMCECIVMCVHASVCYTIGCFRHDYKSMFQDWSDILKGLQWVHYKEQTKKNN